MAVVEMRSPRILVADADAAVLVTFDELLQHYGYAVTSASTGAEARALLLRVHFDLLLIDRTLMDLRGLDVVWSMVDAQPYTAIIILTNDTADGRPPSEEHITPVDSIVKTASIADVLARVASALARHG